MTSTPDDLSTKLSISKQNQNLLNLNEHTDLFSEPENLDDDNDEENEDMEAEFKQLTNKENLQKQKLKSPTKLPSFFLNFQDENLLRCQICTQQRSQFFCENCIKNGDFTSSKQTEIIKERFAEKKLKYIKLKKNLENINQNLQTKINSSIQVNRLKHELAKCNENRGILQENLNSNRQDIDIQKKTFSELDKKVTNNKSRNKALNKKLIALRNDVENKEQQIVDKKLKLNQINETTRQQSKERIFQLTEYIFPLTTYALDENPETGLIYSSESSPLLTFSGESTSSSGEKDDNAQGNEKMMIVEPWLPSNGNYSAYNVWG